MTDLYRALFGYCVVMPACYPLAFIIGILALWHWRDDMTAKRWKWSVNALSWTVFGGLITLFALVACNNEPPESNLPVLSDCQEVPDGKDCSWIGDVGICNGWCLCRFVRTYANPPSSYRVVCTDRSGKVVE